MHTLYSFKAIGWATLGLLQVDSGNSEYFTVAAIFLIAIAVLAAAILFYIIRKNKRLTQLLQKENQLRNLVRDYTKYVVWTVRDEYVTFSGKYTDAAGIPSLQMSLTELLKKNNCPTKATIFNKALIADGYLEERERPSSKKDDDGNVIMKKFKVLTEKGLNYGTNMVSRHNTRETQPLYFEDTFMDLYGKVME